MIDRAKETIKGFLGIKRSRPEVLISLSTVKGAGYSGIRFHLDDEMVGMHLIGDDGLPVRCWPGGVYTLPRERIEKMVPDLERNGVRFEVHYDLPFLPFQPESHRWPLARRLGELEGWQKPSEILAKPE